jgi:hypothetical protein
MPLPSLEQVRRPGIKLNHDLIIPVAAHPAEQVHPDPRFPDAATALVWTNATEVRTPLRVLLTTLAVALAVLFVLYHQSGRRETWAMELAVETGLQRFYDSLAGERPGGVNAGTLFKPEDLTRAVRQELSQPRFFPSFVKAGGVLVSTVDVARGTTNLLCVVQPWDNGRYGLDGSGAARKVSDSELQRWPHSAASAE